MTLTHPHDDRITPFDGRLYRLAADYERLEAGTEVGVGTVAMDFSAEHSMDAVNRTLDRITDELKRLEGDLTVGSNDTKPELCLDTEVTRAQSPIAIMDRLSKVVDTIRTLEASANDAGEYRLAEGLFALSQRFDETLWMMVVNIREAILAQPQDNSNYGLSAGPKT